MIRSFADDEAELTWGGTRSRRLPADIQQVARRKLRMLNSAVGLDDLRVPPANRLRTAWKRSKDVARGSSASG